MKLPLDVCADRQYWTRRVRQYLPHYTGTEVTHTKIGGLGAHDNKIGLECSGDIDDVCRGAPA